MRDRDVTENGHRLNTRFYDQSAYDHEASIKRNLEHQVITEDDTRVLRRYLNDKFALDHISETRAKKLASNLCNMRRFLPAEFSKMTVDDVAAAIAGVQNGEKQKLRSRKGGKYSPESLKDYIGIFLSFVEWLNETERAASPIILSKRRFKNATKIKGAGVTSYNPEDLFTKEEVDAMVIAANTPRDKALISIMFELDARPGEMARMVWGDLSIDENYVKCQIYDTKMKPPGYRYPTIVESRDILAMWRNHYPGKPLKEKFVFVDNDGLELSYIGCKRIVERAAKKAAKTMPSILTKKYWKLHNMRHSGTTHKRNNGWREDDLKEFNWANSNTRMIKRYVNRSRDDMHETVMKIYGIKEEKVYEIKTDTILCPKCRHINPKQNFCGECNWPITEKGKEMMDTDPRMMQKMAEVEELRREIASIKAILDGGFIKRISKSKKAKANP